MLPRACGQKGGQSLSDPGYPRQAGSLLQMEWEYLKPFFPSKICDIFQKTTKAVGDGLWGRKGELLTGGSVLSLWSSVKGSRDCSLGSVLVSLFCCDKIPLQSHWRERGYSAQGSGLQSKMAGKSEQESEGAGPSASAIKKLPSVVFKSRLLPRATGPPHYLSLLPH